MLYIPPCDTGDATVETQVNLLDGTTLDQWRAATQTTLNTLTGGTYTLALIPGTYNPAGFTNLITTLQTLIDQQHQQDTALTNLQNATTGIGWGSVIPAGTTTTCGVLTGISAQSTLQQLLTALICQVITLQSDVAHLKSNQPSGVQLYVPNQ